MRFYKYWARAVGKAIDPDGEEIFRSATGYSNVSAEDAFRMAEERAQKNARYWEGPRNVVGGYYPANGERPIREETVDQFSDNGETYAIVSRNSYGCLVLNTTDVFFADVDKPTKRKPNPLISWIGSLLGKKKAEESDFESRLIERIQRLVKSDSQLGLRIYRTLLGYRVVLTSQTVPTSEASSVELLKKLGSDKLYVSLCQSQDCYRARLTPKAWRCGADKAMIRFPFSSPEIEQQYRQWEARYEKVASKFATCALIGEFGSKQIHPRVEAILKLHDSFVINEGKPLA
jgi:hypothetical protein